MSKLYTVVEGDTFETISTKVYGDATKVSNIQNANQSQTDLKPGDTLIIPDLPTRKALRTAQAERKLINKKTTDFTILIGPVEIKPVSARILRTMDTAVDGWTCVIPWEPGKDLKLDRELIPFRYPNASVYIGSKLIVNGSLYGITASLSSTGRTKTLQGWSFTADAVDSSLKPPYERNNVTLEQIARELVAPLGISAVFETSTGGAFDRVTASATDTIFSHLVKLAEQRGVLISSTPEGDLLFTKAKTTGGIVGTLKEGGDRVTGWRASYDGRKLFSTYRSIGQDPWFNAKPAVARELRVPKARFKTFQGDETTQGDILNTAEWQRSKQMVSAISIRLPVIGWYAPDGSLWRENTLINVVSQTLDIPNGFVFLIKSVEFTLDSNGQSVILDLIPPQAYSGETIPNIWGR